MTNLKVLNLVLAQTNSSALLSGRLQRSQDWVWAVLVERSLAGLLPSGRGQTLSNPGRTAAQLRCSVERGRAGAPVATSVGAGDGCPTLLLPALCPSPVALWPLWPCRDVFWWPPEGPSLLFLRLNAPWSRCCSAPWAQSASCSVCTPTPHPGSPGPKALKCHPAPLLVLYQWGKPLWCPPMSIPETLMNTTLLSPL